MARLWHCVSRATFSLHQGPAGQERQGALETRISTAQISKESDSVSNLKVNHMGLIGFKVCTDICRCRPFFLIIIVVVAIVAAILVAFIKNRSANRTCVAYDTRPCDRRSTLVDKKMNKSDRAIMWLHISCHPKTKLVPCCPST